MNRYRFGVLCQFTGIAIAGAGLIPGTMLLYLCLHWERRDQIEDIYFNTHLLWSLASAFLGFIAGYALIRAGNHFKRL